MNGENRSCLHLAASFGNISMCRTLIECGANVNLFALTSSVCYLKWNNENSFKWNFQGNYLTPYDLAKIRRHNACAEFLLEEYGGQRGNFLATIFVRRIQRFFRRYRRNKTQLLLIQAKICLDNKRIDDQRPIPVHQTRLVDQAEEPTERIVIHRSDPVITSVKLYEKRKLIVDELCKLRQARQKNQFVRIFFFVSRRKTSFNISDCYQSIVVQNSHWKCIQSTQSSSRRDWRIFRTTIEVVRNRTGEYSKTIEGERLCRFFFSLVLIDWFRFFRAAHCVGKIDLSFFVHLSTNKSLLFDKRFVFFSRHTRMKMKRLSHYFRDQ